MKTAGRTRRHVLVVDDSGPARMLIRQALDGWARRTGQRLEVVEAENGFEALRELPRAPFDLVLTDVNMPTLSGLELIRMIRARPEQRGPAGRRGLDGARRRGRGAGPPRQGPTATSRSRSTPRRSTGFSRRSWRRGLRRRREPPEAGRRRLLEGVPRRGGDAPRGGRRVPRHPRRRGDDPNPAKVNALFRAVHSLKGVAAMVGFAGIADAAHDLEALLDDVRMGRVAPTPAARAAVRDGLAALASLVSRVAAGEEAPALARPLRERLELRSGVRDPARGRGRTHPPARPRRVALRLRAAPRRRGGAARQGARPRRPRLRLRHVRRGAPDGDGRGLGGGRADRDVPGRPRPIRRGWRFVFSWRFPPASTWPPSARRCGARRVEALATEAPPAPPPGPGPAAAVRRGARAAGRKGRRPGAAGEGGALVDLAGELALARGALERALGRAFAGAPDRARVTRRNARSPSSTGSSRLSGRRPSPSGSSRWRRLRRASPARSPGRPPRSGRTRTSSFTASRPRSTRSSPTSSPTLSSTS